MIIVVVIVLEIMIFGNMVAVINMCPLSSERR